MADTARAERLFYTGMAVAMILIVIAGFAPSFYLRGLVHYPRPNPSLPPLVLAHGIFFSIWMLIFLVQSMLVTAGRRSLHRTLGGWSLLYGAALIPLMLATAIGQVARASQPPGFTPLQWMAVPAFTIPAFALFLWAGYRWRRQPQVHKRVMLGAAILMLDPAIGRLPIFPDGQLGLFLSDALGWSPYLALFAWDWLSLRRIHWASLCVAGAAAATLVLRNIALQSDWWPEVAGWLVGVPT